ncbi:hypothetical protein [Gottfriedia acidiceleris]|uniref:hypothetical protein n=1 Tax=Gottfriedia acidiceleris TaxID=371036 RepID=UPI0013EA0953|nr:hypothetical protein [Gottfriedia acidiceleris]
MKNYVEELPNGILRSVEELKLLYPDRKITTNAVYEWMQFTNQKKVFGKSFVKISI